jgi:hypothetical protein
MDHRPTRQVRTSHACLLCCVPVNDCGARIVRPRLRPGRGGAIVLGGGEARAVGLASHREYGRAGRYGRDWTCGGPATSSTGVPPACHLLPALPTPAGLPPLVHLDRTATGLRLWLCGGCLWPERLTLGLSPQLRACGDLGRLSRLVPAAHRRAVLLLADGKVPMPPEVNELLDRIARAGWNQGIEEWAVLRIMLIIERWAGGKS